MDQRYDVVVAGAGVVGLAVAWRAAEAGLSVLVADPATSIAAGASGVAAGMLAPVTEATFGEEDLLKLNLRASSEYPTFIEALRSRTAKDPGYFETAAMHVAIDRDQHEALSRLFAFQRSLGLDCDWLDAEGCLTAEPGLHHSVLAGILAPNDHSIDPRRLCEALSSAAKDAGVDFALGRAVQEVEPARRKVTIDGKNIAYGWFVAAAGCWTSSIHGLPGWAQEAVRPVKGQAIRTSPQSGTERSLGVVIRTDDVYIVPRHGGDAVIGATVEEQGFDTSTTVEGVYQLLRSAIETVPALRHHEIVETSAGLRPASRDNLPLIGACGPGNVLLATGHFRNGILLADVTANAIVNIIETKLPDPGLEPFDPSRFEN
ncbi:MAG: glycine oxidase ThiO [Actinomycetota bacterium]|nr:glycine oxidase ThiO [Actinomycetota bacterium]